MFIFRPCCHELKEDLSSKFGDMEITNSGLTINCTLTQRTPNCRSIAKNWSSDVQSAVDTFVDRLLEKTIEVKNNIWEGVCDFLDKGKLSYFHTNSKGLFCLPARIVQGLNLCLPLLQD